MSNTFSQVQIGFLFLLSCLQATIVESHIRVYRIVGGTDCSIKEYPFLVAVTVIGEQTCIGTLLNFKWGMTAAHCFMTYNLPPEWFAIRPLIYERGSKVQESAILKYVAHPNYTNENGHSGCDIALFRLATVINLPGNMGYVQIPSNRTSSSLVYECEESSVVGWGMKSLDENGTILKRHLQCLNVFVISKSHCQRHFVPEIRVLDTHLCAESVQGTDVCPGDSGGPLMCNNVQQGIVASGPGCIEKSAPVFYTRVDRFLDFINETMNSKEEPEQLSTRTNIVAYYRSKCSKLQANLCLLAVTLLFILSQEITKIII